MRELEHALSLVAEEAAEIVHACTKAMRFGVHDGVGPLSNIDVLQKEFNDFLATIDNLNSKLEQEDIICQDDDLINLKQDKIKHYTVYATATGAIEPDPVVERDREPALDEPDLEEKIIHEQYGEEFQP